MVNKKILQSIMMRLLPPVAFGGLFVPMRFSILSYAAFVVFFIV